uniref:Uncharacterized protein n=1 Tax=Coccidioides posadasii RMSCC 3488 TaxID=454284 RepID=A0A0J6III4_COCPO|nr:hypothetical protein CPAG_07960 [Coccidioides posadasii RMSCC 3488]
MFYGVLRTEYGDLAKGTGCMTTDIKPLSFGSKIPAKPGRQARMCQQRCNIAKEILDRGLLEGHRLHSKQDAHTRPSFIMIMQSLPVATSFSFRSTSFTITPAFVAAGTSE